MEWLIDGAFAFFREFNIQTIFSLGAIVWYFTRDIKNSIDNLDKHIRDMNTRVSRLEGTVYGTDLYNLKEKK
jgi:hypothetical protein